MCNGAGAIIDTKIEELLQCINQEIGTGSSNLSEQNKLPVPFSGKVGLGTL
jgi:hypothetical protein